MTYCSKTFCDLIKAIIIGEFIEVSRLENRLKFWIKKEPKERFDILLFNNEGFAWIRGFFYFK